LPSKPSVLAASWTLRDMEEASVTGQMVSVRTMVSVTKTVERASAGSDARSAALVGQLVMVGAHEVTVRMAVVRTVRVVRPAAVAVAFGKTSVPFVMSTAEDTAASEDTAAAEDTADDETVSEARALSVDEAASELTELSPADEAASELTELTTDEDASEATELSTDEAEEAAADAEETAARTASGATEGSSAAPAVTFWPRRIWMWRGCE